MGTRSFYERLHYSAFTLNLPICNVQLSMGIARASQAQENVCEYPGHRVELEFATAIVTDHQLGSAERGQTTMLGDQYIKIGIEQ